LHDLGWVRHCFSKKTAGHPLLHPYTQQQCCWCHDPLRSLKVAHGLPDFLEHVLPWLWFKLCQGFLKRRTPPGGEYFKGKSQFIALLSFRVVSNLDREAWFCRKTSLKVETIV